MRIIVDGQVYEREQDVPEFGSIECVGVDGQSNVRQYQCLSADVSKLNQFLTYPASGSTCLVLDTSQMYVFSKSSETWYLIET